MSQCRSPDHTLVKHWWSTRLAPLLTALFKFYNASAEGATAFSLLGLSTTIIRVSQCLWTHLGSNQGPIDYESIALTG
ncbi:hypothetical protein UFOVP449_203 [uncultured Caudovirales phage]|uniref:Uncharacterized protein n=1 Tax=uncultured Caudovirales phage TaxID=2100421 RepID=A0A6J5M8Z5_9CAUD|nr:hypothetical protein UFOVP449_203 [uncultured Caudovirales phage]